MDGLIKDAKSMENKNSLSLVDIRLHPNKAASSIYLEQLKNLIGFVIALMEV